MWASCTARVCWMTLSTTALLTWWTSYCVAWPAKALSGVHHACLRWVSACSASCEQRRPALEVQHPALQSTNTCLDDMHVVNQAASASLPLATAARLCIWIRLNDAIEQYHLSFLQVLRGVPFLQKIDESLYEFMYAHGRVLRFEPGASMLSSCFEYLSDFNKTILDITPASPAVRLQDAQVIVCHNQTNKWGMSVTKCLGLFDKKDPIEINVHDAGQVIWSAPEASDEHRTGGVPRAGNGIFVVIAGLARWTFITPDKERQVRRVRLHAGAETRSGSLDRHAGLWMRCTLSNRLKLHMHMHMSGVMGPL